MARKALVQQIGRKIVGHQDVVENLVASILAGGHVMIVGVPGLAKTLLVQTVSKRSTSSSRACNSRPT